MTMTTEKKVLFVDDDESILSAMRRQFRKEFDLTTASSANEALEQLKSNGPFAVIVSDQSMPGMDGTRFFAEARKISPHSTRIMMTGDARLEAVMQAVNEGNIFRFLTKPCPRELLEATIHAGLEQHQLVTAQKVLLTQTLQGSIKVLVDILTLIGAEIFGHAQRIKAVSIELAENMELTSRWELEIASMLSMLGCVTVPTQTITKFLKHDRLSATDREIYQNHPQVGHDLIANIPRLDGIANIVLYQDKNYDGTGFPNNDLSGADIPIESRIIKVASTYVRWLDQNISAQDAVNRLKESPHYDQAIVRVLQDSVSHRKPSENLLIRTIVLEELRTGMVLAKDLSTVDGTIMLVKKGQQISDVLLQRIKNFHKQTPIMNTVDIMVN